MIVGYLVNVFLYRLNGGKSEKLNFFMYIYINIFIYMDNKVIIDDGVDNDIK